MQHAPLDSASRASISYLFIHDDYAGHRNQLTGLMNELSLLSASEITLCHYKDIMTRAPDQIDIVVGAGHATHRPLLKLALRQGAFSALVMKPSLPRFLFDAIITPKHDGIASSARIFNTLGPINNLGRESTSTAGRNLILLGGPSRHFKWEDTRVSSSIAQLVEPNAQAAWLIATSRRTPNSMLTLLKQHFPDIPILQSNETLTPALCDAKQVWVTADSSSMIFESLSLAKRTGIIELPDRTRFNTTFVMRSRLRKQLDELYDRQMVLTLNTPYVHKNINTERERLNEASKAAQWLLNRYLDSTQARNRGTTTCV